MNDSQKECSSMSEAVREYAKQYAAEQSLIAVIKTKIETIKNMLAENISLDKALKMTNLDRQTYEKYSNMDETQDDE